MTARHPRIFMPLYGQIDDDGRVQRAAEALSDIAEVVVFSIASEGRYSNERFASKAVSLKPFSGPGVSWYLVFVSKMLAAAVTMKPDVVYAHDYFLSLPGLVAARLSGARFVYDAHELIVPKKGRPLGQRRDFFYALEKRAVRKADLVIAASPERAELMQRHYGLPARPTDVQNISPSAYRGGGSVLARYPRLARGANVGIKLVYQGYFDRSRDLAPFVRAMCHLNEGFELVCVGDGPELARLRTLADELGVADRIAFLGRVPHKDLQAMLEYCDIGIVSYSNEDLNNVYCAPNKVYEYAQAGLAVLATDQLPLVRLVEGGGIGVVIGDAGDEEAQARLIADKARFLVDNLKNFKNETAEFARLHTWEKERSKLVAAVSRLTASTSTGQ